MQAAHPVAFAGFFAHTGALDDPYERLNRTTLIMNTVAFGTAEHAARATARVRAMHARVSGKLEEPAGPVARRARRTPRRTPDLLPVDPRHARRRRRDDLPPVGGPLSARDLDRLWQDYLVVGEHFGLPRSAAPGSWTEFRDYWHGMLDGGDLHVTPQARELAIEIVLHPPLPFLARPLVEVVNQITIGSLPRQVRELYGWRWDPVRDLALGASREAVRRLVRPLLPDPLARIPVARHGLGVAEQQQAAALRDRANVAA
jgi:uncharacterized protein (DUF2236 family)